MTTSGPRGPLPGLVDAHAHTWSREFWQDHDHVMERAWAAGLGAIVEVGVDVATSLSSLDLARRDARVHAVAGLHPHEARKWEQERDALAALLDTGDLVAVGEIGLDFYRDLSPREEQVVALRAQLNLAHERGLPVVIHSRNADDECFGIVEPWARSAGRYLGPDREIGMMHCFAGDASMAARYLDLGFLISVPGTVTYPGSERGRRVARTIPLAGMLLETDCPYLTPVPYRGKRNEPAHVAETARFVASLRDLPAVEVARVTGENAARLFGFAAPSAHGSEE